MGNTNSDPQPDLGPPLGARMVPEGVEYRIWTTRHEHVAVVVSRGRRFELQPETSAGAGYFRGVDPQGRAGDLYHYEVEDRLLADPAGRFQPGGVSGPSQVIDATTFAWRANPWRRPALCGRVIYELHVGTFTPAGTFAAAVEKLDALVELGINTIELMPVADFAGDWNWGYDGVMLFAPARCYGTPDELRALIDAAHARRLAVILDVVYNHLGPVGNVLPTLAAEYFHARETGWGAALNLDGPGSLPVRRFLLQNAAMWLDEYRIDGLRLDATHAIHDRSPRHLLAELGALARSRDAFVIAEDDRNDATLITPAEAGGLGLDGVWSDDFHHAVRVGLTRERHGYLASYSGSTGELGRILQDGWLYSGQHFPFWGRPRGSAAGHLPPSSFVVCISNHDQVGNRPRGDRLHQSSSAAAYRAASMLLCLAPYTPLIFQGQEWAASTPFPFFSNHPGEIGANVARNRRAELARVHPMDFERMPDPQAEATFQQAKLNWRERQAAPHAGILALYRECLALRAAHPVFQSCERRYWRVHLLGELGVRIEWHHPDGRWALVFSLSSPVEFVPPSDAEPWQQVLASNEARFGGEGSAVTAGPAAVLWRAAAPGP